MESNTLLDKLKETQESLFFLGAEWWISMGLLVLIIVGLILHKTNAEKIKYIVYSFSILLLIGSLLTTLADGFTAPANELFHHMLVKDGFASFLKILFDISGVLTLTMSFHKNTIHKHYTEYVSLLLTIILGAHLLVMSTNFAMLFISLEMISIPSYVLAGYGFNKQGSEGSLKYFLFGSVASAIMLYGMSLLYGITGTLTFSSDIFSEAIAHSTTLSVLALLLVAAGLLFKIGAIPMHIWIPDIYEASPMPVVAFFSVVPKLAGVGILTRFINEIHSENNIDWQVFIGIIALLTILIGNLGALKQQKLKRLMAYSSIAQSGFMLVGVVVFLPEGIHFMLFYASVYVIANYLIFMYLQVFETHSVLTIEDFAGTGRQFIWPHIFMLVGFISLAGLPPTAGFTGKLFLFSVLWKSFEMSGNELLVWLFGLGLLNTVIALFYYIRVPFFAFIKEGGSVLSINFKNINLLGFILVISLLILFFLPFLLMGWINKITFVF